MRRQSKPFIPIPAPLPPRHMRPPAARPPIGQSPDPAPKSGTCDRDSPAPPPVYHLKMRRAPWSSEKEGYARALALSSSRWVETAVPRAFLSGLRRRCPRHRPFSRPSAPNPTGARPCRTQQRSTGRRRFVLGTHHHLESRPQELRDVPRRAVWGAGACVAFHPSDILRTMRK